MPPLAVTPADADVILLPVPYDSTTSYRTGARHGPSAITIASRQLEDYDLELDRDVSTVGIYTAPELEADVSSPEAMVGRVEKAVRSVARHDVLVGVLGGDHSVTIGAVRALKEIHPNLSVLYLDAHADMRDEYMGTRWGHASGARRIHESCPLVLVGLRSICPEELAYLKQYSISAFFWPPDGDTYIEKVLASLGPNVYISVDLDVFDSSLMPAVGTPEPGGMTWHQVTQLLRAVGSCRNIVGFDVSELAPSEGPAACAYTAAKLVYKLVAHAARPSD